MNRWEIEGILSKISYKPGWKFTVPNNYIAYGSAKDGYIGYSEVLIHITYEAPDTRRPFGMTTIGKGCLVPFYVDTPRRLVEFVYRVIQELEMHEALEHFKFNEKLVTDPHDKDNFIGNRQPVHPDFSKLDI